MPPTYSSFAILGYGSVAQHIVAALSEIPQVTITILTRNQPSGRLPPHAKVALIQDYTNSNGEITRILQDVARAEVVINATKVTDFGFHKTLADAVRAARGVKLFVPSEFGNVTEGMKGNFKAELHPYMRKIGLPYVLIYCNNFIHGMPWLTQTDSGKFYIIGSGTTQSTFTSLTDVAGFTAHVLTHLSPSTLHNKSFRLQGDRLSLVQVSKYFEDEYDVVHLPADENIPGSDEDAGVMFASVVQRWMEKGMGSTGWDNELGRDIPELAGSGNKYWEGHAWETVEDYWG